MEKVHRPKIINTCPNCESRNVLVNQSGKKWCRRCGHSWYEEKTIPESKQI